MRWSERAVGVSLAVVGLSLAAVVLRASESHHPPLPSKERLLYLRSGDTARRVMLSFDALAADIYWIRAIQHYGHDKRSNRVEGRFELLQPLLDLTTTLDPYFNVAYRFGAMFLSITPPQGPGRSDQAIALLKKGLAHNPTNWRFAHDIGFVHYFYTKDYQEAARWFKAAAGMPRAPGWIQPLAAATSLQGGDLAGADAIFRELAQSPEKSIQQTAQRGLAQVEALRRMGLLDQAIARFHKATGRYPASWQELIATQLLPGLPIDPTGVPFIYDAPTHTVVLGADSTLAPLPQLSR